MMPVELNTGEPRFLNNGDQETGKTVATISPSLSNGRDAAWPETASKSPGRRVPLSQGGRQPRGDASKRPPQQARRAFCSIISKS
jgi:hypothetical protein